MTSVIAGAAMAITLSSRQLLDTDEQRTLVNQNLRIGMELMGIEIRQAGERLPADLPAIQILDGASGAADTLILRRNVLDQVMPVCKEIKGGTAADSVFIALKKGSGKVPPGCAPVPDLNADGWPDNLEVWREYRIASAGEILAYIYNPTTRLGEYFLYDDEDNSTFHLHRKNPGQWVNDYAPDDQARVYIIEQLTVRLVDDVLQTVVNDDEDHAYNLVSSMSNFQARAFFLDGSVSTTLGPTDEWADLLSIEITLEGEGELGDITIERDLTTQFFPRNIFSSS